MTRDLPPLDPDDEDERPERPAGHVRTTTVGPLVVFFLTGLVLGWLLRPVSVRVVDRAPLVGWTPVLALLLVALILISVAWVTYRDLHRRGHYLEPHRAVNRLVLAKACALAGAAVAGAYFGYALSWWGISEAPLAQQRLVRSAVGGVGGLLIVGAALALEWACRVRGGGEPKLP